MGAATRVREAGWMVAVVDFRPYGGTCALRGCDPKKMLVAGAYILIGEGLRRKYRSDRNLGSFSHSVGGL